jgi:hypothetical protein
MYIICILVIPISNYVMYVFWWDSIRDSRPVVLTIGHLIVKLIKKILKKIKNSKGRRFDSHRGQAYFSSLPGVDIHSE